MNDPETWTRLVASYCAPSATATGRDKAQKMFLGNPDRAAIIKAHLLNNRHWWLAYRLVRDLTIEERIALLPELVHRLFNTRTFNVWKTFSASRKKKTPPFPAGRTREKHIEENTMAYTSLIR